jgi:hypothetical protein
MSAGRWCAANTKLARHRTHEARHNIGSQNTHADVQGEKFKRKERRHGKRDCKWALCRIESIDRARETMVLVVTGSMNVFACNLVIVIFLVFAVFAVFIVFDLFVIFVVFVVFAWG